MKAALAALKKGNAQAKELDKATSKYEKAVKVAEKAGE